MSTAFRRARGGAVSASFHQAEADLLRSLVTQLLELLHDRSSAGDAALADDPLAAAIGIEDDSSRPTDPVVLRLFPDGYRADDEAAREFRRFTERGLREKKTEAAVTVLASLAAAGLPEPDQVTGSSREKIRLRLDQDEAAAWLRTLTDLRLALGTRLGVQQGDDEIWDALPDDDPRRQVHHVYEWLGWVQETLVRAIATGLA
ncbi:MAG: DUF2017 domain-containing protein [Jiangellaceae bacterium]|nr:DUF2017 domain-containing protein [Jiangellaceae bacterium]